jgi:hypothetical protein
MDVFAIDYESLMADHRAVIGEIAGWLGALDQFRGSAGAWDVDRAASLVVDELRHQPADDDGRGHLLSEHRALVERMAGLRGGHRQFDPGAPTDESPWTTDLLSMRRASRPLSGRVRDLEALDEERRQQVAELRAELGASRYALDQSERTLREHQQVLEATHAELEKFVRIVDNMHESTSWKVTKPLRTVTAKVQRGQPRPGGSG